MKPNELRVDGAGRGGQTGGCLLDLKTVSCQYCKHSKSTAWKSMSIHTGRTLSRQAPPLHSTPPPQISQSITCTSVERTALLGLFFATSSQSSSPRPVPVSPPTIPFRASSRTVDEESVIRSKGAPGKTPPPVDFRALPPSLLRSPPPLPPPPPTLPRASIPLEAVASGQWPVVTLFASAGAPAPEEVAGAPGTEGCPEGSR